MALDALGVENRRHVPGKGRGLREGGRCRYKDAEYNRDAHAVHEVLRATVYSLSIAEGGSVDCGLIANRAD
jgi:hypothetical protein